jgi:hypothetical protein
MRNRRLSRPLLLGGSALLVMALAAAVVLLVDPFGWRLLDKASGLRDEAASAVPPNAGLYTGIDLINFSEETLTEFSRPFVTALAEPGVQDLAGGLDRLDARLAEEIGLTLRDNVMPWLGRSVGLAVTELTLRPDGSIDHMGWLLVAGTQDRQAADDFLEQLAQQLTQRTGIDSARAEYRGRTITHFDPEEALPAGGVAFTRSAGLVIVAPDEAAVRAAIDAQQGQSLADDESFQQLTASLPEQRGLTLFIDQGRMPALSHLLAAAAPLSIGPLDLTSLTLPPVAAGVSIVDQGLRVDLAAPANADAIDLSNDRELAGRLPADTVAFLTGDSLDESWQALKRSLASAGNLADFEESMALLGREFGYNPDQSLLPVLDGEWLLALLPAQEGLVQELAGQPVGLVLLARSTNPGALAQAVGELSQGLASQRLPLATIEVGGATATTVDLASLIGAPLPYYGVSEDVLFLGTDTESLDRVLTSDGLASEGLLYGVQAYQAASAMLPDGYRTSAYVDLASASAVIDVTGLGQPARLVEPIKGVIAASGPVSDGVRSGLLIVIVP